MAIADIDASAQPSLVLVLTALRKKQKASRRQKPVDALTPSDLNREHSKNAKLQGGVITSQIAKKMDLNRRNTCIGFEIRREIDFEPNRI